jgi:hypothetical protein
VARHGRPRAGRWPVQVRYACGLTGEEYVTQQAWRNASLPVCPFHPRGGCGYHRHGTYERLSPPGTLIARWYCRQGHCTISMLPDCLPARLSGTFVELESLLRQVEQAPSLAAACTDLRPEIELPGVLRWVRWRVQAVYSILIILKGLMPAVFQICEPTLQSFASQLGIDPVLPALRSIAAPWLHRLPPPLGFCSRSRPGGEANDRHQQSVGPDPPVSLP